MWVLLNSPIISFFLHRYVSNALLCSPLFCSSFSLSLSLHVIDLYLHIVEASTSYESKILLPPLIILHITQDPCVETDFVFELIWMHILPWCICVYQFFNGYLLYLTESELCTHFYSSSHTVISSCLSLLSNIFMVLELWSSEIVLSLFFIKHMSYVHSLRIYLYVNLALLRWFLNTGSSADALIIVFHHELVFICTIFSFSISPYMVL